MLVVDRALENIGTDLDDVAGTVGFHLGVCPGRAPWFKGKIERFLGSLNRKLLHAQRGTTFSNIMERDDYDPAKNAVITLGELHYVIHRWLLDIYSCRAHDGIKDVPYRRWEELCRKFPVQPIENIGQLDMMLGRTETRTLSRSGIKFEKQTYISDELVSLLSDPTFRRLSPDLSVTFKYDAGDLGQIRVFDPRFRDYISVDSDNQAYAKGLSLWQNTIIEKYAKTRLAGRVDRESIVRAKVELAAFFESAWRRNQKIGSRRTAARFQGVGRYAMAGADHRTRPDAASGARVAR
jgi:putative transposase